MAKAPAAAAATTPTTPDTAVVDTTAQAAQTTANDDTGEEDFEAAFARLSELGDTNAKKPVAAAAAAVADTATAAAGDTAAGDDVSDDEIETPEQVAAREKEAADAAAAAAASAAGKSATPEPTPDPLERLAATLEKRFGAAPAEKTPVTPAAQQPAPFTPDEIVGLTQYEKDFPEVAHYEGLRRRAEYQQIVNYVFDEVAKTIKPLLDQQATVAARLQLEDLQTTVEGYSDDLVDKVVAWTKTQPKYLQPAFDHVIKQGTVEEIADLVSRYHLANPGAVTTQATTPATTPKTATELPSATKKAAAALAPVSSKRTTPVSTPDVNDFDGAFAAFADKI